MIYELQTIFLIFLLFQTSVAAPSHQELKVCGRFGDWIRNDIQYCSFQVNNENILETTVTFCLFQVSALCIMSLSQTPKF